MQNRYPGLCACGGWVESNEGVTFKEAGKWLVRCDYCTRQAAAPEREMLGSIYWPNGAGETLCTVEYEDAVGAARDAREAVAAYERDSYDAQEPDSRAERNRLEHAVYTAENKVAELQLAGGHLGERITYDAPDPLTALLGGGRITIRPGGEVGIAE